MGFSLPTGVRPRRRYGTSACQVLGWCGPMSPPYRACDTAPSLETLFVTACVTTAPEWRRKPGPDRSICKRGDTVTNGAAFITCPRELLGDSWAWEDSNFRPHAYQAWRQEAERERRERPWRDHTGGFHVLRVSVLGDSRSSRLDSTPKRRSAIAAKTCTGRRSCPIYDAIGFGRVLEQDGDGERPGATRRVGNRERAHQALAPSASRDRTVLAGARRVDDGSRKSM